jgi:hypothetical protein
MDIHAGDLGTGLSLCSDGSARPIAPPLRYMAHRFMVTCPACLRLMTSKAEKLNKLVDAIPGVCSGGRDGIRALVAELSGETLVEEPKVTHKIGDHFKFGSKTFLLAVATDHPSDVEKRVVAINIATGSRRSPLNGTPVNSYIAITEDELSRILRVSTHSLTRLVTKVHTSELAVASPLRSPTRRTW